jgi:hypothetical protein
MGRLSDRFRAEKKLDWVVAFCKQQGLTLRAPEQCSIGREIGFNTAQMTLFFGNLKTCYERNKFPPERCFNLDKTGMSTVPASVPKFVTTEGKKTNVCKETSEEMGQTVTTVCCMSASGLYALPALILSRKQMAPNLLPNAPTGTLALAAMSSFMNSELFPEWVQHHA